mgnify:CR=1 FL=1
MKKFFFILVFLGTSYGALCAEYLSVLSFNILRGGKDRLPAIIEVIRKLEPDVVGIQEAKRSLEKIANQLGYYFDEKSSIISRYPIIKSFKITGRKIKNSAVIEVKNKKVTFINVHLYPYPYTPYRVRDGKPPYEKHRFKEIKKIMEIYEKQQLEGPTFMLGDFNTVSHLDWTDTPKKELPVTSFLEEKGFIDAYRVIHPLPEMSPGYTWTPDLSRGPNETQDRIDYIFYKGPIRPLSMKVIDGPDWPSDHRAVFGRFFLQDL